MKAMNHRMIAIFLTIFSVGLIGVGYLLRNPFLVGLCPSSTDNCLSESLRYGIGSPLFWSIYLLPVLFFVLAFIRREIFSAWWKVALPVGIVFLVVIFVTPPLGENISADRTTVTAALVKIFVFVSAIVIAWKYWRLRSGRKIVG
ncbi:MAG: hypothetical protein UY61_C0060G0003 [Candidatus Adlerbacteria bacterium GW2011_GWC1_50_9]|uniref:Uncharacterized protein n=1 Tax=Candidatus Adlerbacteria bacterium GW2011_GWC1_50_9 TaxID=1618608 RepID=A0A0G1WKH3_9BACT|nr:MAG: hypothetical protein UY61_C0060G0003 [Candidatus Adlerbacteria bacterium GW2011_GWC1_50_9]